MLCVMMSLFLVGCGKKKDAEKKHDKVSGKAKSGKLFTSAAQGENAVYTDEANDLFEDSTVADLAFVDDADQDDNALDLNQEKEDGITVASVDFDSDGLSADGAWGEEAFDANEDYDEISIDDLSVDDSLQTAFADGEEDNFDLNESLETDEGFEEVRFKTVHFDINQKNVKKDEKDLLEENIALAAQAVEEGFDVVIEGHSCPLKAADPGYNLALSQQRAESVKQEMVKRGIPAKHIKTLAFGNEAPIAFTDAPSKAQQIKDLAPNRRIEISVS